MNAVAILRLEAAVTQMTNVLLRDIAVRQAGLQQTYTLDDLQARYRGHGRDAIKVRLQRLGMYPAETGPGRSITITLDQLLQLDAVYAGRLDESQCRETDHAA